MKSLALIVTIMFVVTVLPVGTVYAQAVTPPKGTLTGSHASLDCDMCHQAGVWHTTSKDVKVCQKCHQDQWNTLTKNSMHMALMRNGTLDRDSGTYQLKYCATCHDPHHNDYLRITSKNGNETYYKLDNPMPLCLNCHSFGGNARPISDIGMGNNNTGRTTTTTTKTTTQVTTTTNTTTTSTTTKAKETTLSLVPSALAASVSSQLTLRGQIDPPKQGTEVEVKSRSSGDNTPWTSLGNAVTDTEGKYEIAWVPDTPGSYVLMASTGSIESGVYTVLISAPTTNTGANGGFLGLLQSPIFLVMIAAAVAVAVGAVFLIRKKRS